MKRTLSNEALTITVNEQGAELCSLKGSGGVEYLWQADPNVWGRHAPVLFPIVGKLANDSYTYKGNTYRLGQHGFARDMQFQVQDVTPNSLAFRLNSTDATLQSYPFEFALMVSYRLGKNSLEVGYSVRNNGSETMPFSIGAHPGFSLNWGEGDRIEDYFLEFEYPESADTHFLNEDGLLSEQKTRVLHNESSLLLTANLFDKNALIFLEMKSKKVSLRSRRHGTILTVEYPGFPHLGIWAKPGAPYVCIEPWHGYVSPMDFDGDFLHKPGIVKLSPQQSFDCVHRISVEESK